jgi:CheY-like chemotaxis protein
MNEPKHLLLIDDEDEFLVLTRLLLEMEGFRVSTAGSGEQALAMYEGGLRPDLVLLDYRMPGLSGAQTLQRLRGSGLRVPTLLLSAVSSIGQTAADDGFDAYLPKPFTIEDLLDVVQRLLYGPQPA